MECGLPPNPKGRPPIKLGVFYLKAKDIIHQDDRHLYSFEVGTQEELKTPKYGEAATNVQTIDVSALPTKIRSVLERYYNSHKQQNGKIATHPQCGNIEYKVFDDGDRKIGYASDYVPMRKMAKSDGEKMRPPRHTGMGSFFEVLSLRHLIPMKQLTHIATYDGLEKDLDRPGNFETLCRLPNIESYRILRARKVQLRKKHLDTMKVYPAELWMERLSTSKKTNPRHPTRFATSKNKYNVEHHARPRQPPGPLQ